MTLNVASRPRSGNPIGGVLVVRGAKGEEALAYTDGSMRFFAAGSHATGPGTGDRIVVLGNRYIDEGTGIELGCTRAGPVPLRFGGHEPQIKSALLLPASD